MGVIADPTTSTIQIVQGGRRTMIDATPLRTDGTRTQFKDPKFFQQVSLSSDGQRLVWPQGNEHRIADLVKGDFQRRPMGYAPAAG